MNLNVLKKPKLMALGLPMALLGQCGPQQCAPAAPKLPSQISIEDNGAAYWSDPNYPAGQWAYQDARGRWYFTYNGNPSSSNRYYFTYDDLWGTGDVDGDRMIDREDPDSLDEHGYDDCVC